MFVTFIVTNLIFYYYTPKSDFFFKGHYGWTWLGVSIVIVIFLIAFVIPRFWCNIFCPIGSFGDIVLKVETKLKAIFK